MSDFRHNDDYQGASFSKRGMRYNHHTHAWLIRTWRTDGEFVIIRSYHLTDGKSFL